MSYLLVLGAISLLVLLHEAGHLLAAKLTGIPIARFSIGFGRRLWGFNRSGTEYQFCLIPIGGYVLPAVTDRHEFECLPLRNRLLFFLGGPLANLLGAALCLSILDSTRLGFSVETALVLPLKQTGQILAQIGGVIPMLFSQPDQLSGVVGIVVAGGQHVGMDPLRLLEFGALLNVNLALMNLLPILPLDGGKILMNLLERICQPLRKLEIALTLGGWALLLGLMLYATVMDVSRIIRHPASNRLPAIEETARTAVDRAKG